MRRRRPACSRGWQGGASREGGEARRAGRSLDILSTVHSRTEERRKESSKAVFRPSSRLVAIVIVVVVLYLSISWSVFILALCLGDLGRNPPTRALNCSGQIIQTLGGDSHPDVKGERAGNLVAFLSAVGFIVGVGELVADAVLVNGECSYLLQQRWRQGQRRSVFISYRMWWTGTILEYLIFIFLLLSRDRQHIFKSIHMVMAAASDAK